MTNLKVQWWLEQEDIAPSTSPADPAAGQSAMGDVSPMNPNMPQPDPNAPPEQEPEQEQPEDITQDPQVPEMPEEKKSDDFETWKKNYFRESIKGDTQTLIDLLNQVRDREHLNSYQEKFIEDNFNIQLIRQNANVQKASNEVRKLIKDQLDQTMPATTVVNHLSDVLESNPLLVHSFIKVSGYGALKQDLHRKLISSLLGAVQVSSGTDSEDIIVNEREYSIQLSTRMNSRWGDVVLGNWSLHEDDPSRYLSEPEQKRLTEGSPEERDVLRRRIVMESISKQFQTRAFLINVVGDDGTTYALGWDLANCLRAAYTEGKLHVESVKAENSDALIDSSGNIVPLMDIKVSFVRETGRQTHEDKPETENVPFMERRNGLLFLSANLKTIKDAANALQGFVLKELPYNGNPSDLKVLKRCIYSAHDLLLRQC